ncbi:MAG: hypothetical protein RL309_1277 [Verrucomicrobiota bacterium]|jgi:hypothetical protein
MGVKQKRRGMAMAAALAIIALCAILATALLSSAGKIRRAHDAGPNRPLLRAECAAALRCALLKQTMATTTSPLASSDRTSVETIDLRGLLPLRAMDEASMRTLLIVCGVNPQEAGRAAIALLEGYRKDARYGRVQLTPAELSHLSGLTDPSALRKISSSLNGSPDAELKVDPAHCNASALATICALRNVDPTVTAQKLAAGAKPEEVFQPGPGPVLGTLPESYLILVKARNASESLEMSQVLKVTASGWQIR